MTKQVIGITGGIGCGKSVVMEILKKEYGAAVILADTVGHDLMKPGAMNYNGILKHFGNEILSEDGQIDRKKLGAIVFSNQDHLTALNQITHPNIIKEIQNRIHSYLLNPDVPFVCLESAILLDTDLYKLCDKIMYVYADESVRIERLMAGRGYTKDYCKTVMAKQKDEGVYREKSHYVINNSGSVEDTKLKIKEIFL